jgi:hypothetical protein
MLGVGDEFDNSLYERHEDWIRTIVASSANPWEAV